MKRVSMTLVMLLLAIISNAVGQVEVSADAKLTLRGHVGIVFLVESSPDGRHLASAGADKTVRIWNLDLGLPEHLLSGHKAEVLALSYKPNGTRLASGDREGNIIIWDPVAGKGLKAMRAPSAILALDFHPFLDRVASAGEDGQLYLWDTETGKQLSAKQVHSDWISGLSYSREGAFLASSGYDGEVKLTMENATSSLGIQNENAVNALCFDPDGANLAVAVMGGDLKSIEVPAGVEAVSFKTENREIISIGFSSRGEMLAAASMGGRISLWDTSSGSLLQEFESGQGEVNSVTFIGQKNELASAGGDGTIKVWGMSTVKKTNQPPVIAVTAPVSGSRVAVAQASLSASITDDSEIKRVIVRHNAQPIIDQRLPAAMPDLAAAGISLTAGTGPGLKTGAALTIARQLNLVPGENTIEILASDGELTDSEIIRIAYTMMANQPPAIAVSSPMSGSTVDVSTTLLSASISDDRELRHLVVMLNDKPIIEEFLPTTRSDLATRGINVVPRIESGPQTGSAIRIDRPLELRPGENIIEIAASDGELTGTEIIRVVYEAIKQSGIQRWAVVAGISRYQNPGISSLRYADRDAEAFYQFLKTPAGGGFADDHIMFLLNEQVTYQNLRSALFDFLRQAIEEDLVIIYFAGHGAPEPDNPNNLYLLTYDTDPKRMASTAFPMWDIETAFEKHIRAGKVILLADACHSAGVAGGIGTRAPAENLINKYLIQLMTAKSGRVTFTASEAGEFSRESPEWGGGHGAFTYYLLEALKGAADVNGDGIITLGEAIDYTDEGVRRATNSQQHPDTAGRFDRSLPMSVIK